MMLRSRMRCERFATRNTLFYPRPTELSTGTLLIFKGCLDDCMYVRRHAGANRKALQTLWETTAALTRRSEIVSNSGFPARTPCK